MGAEIMGAGTDVIKIRGVERLHGAVYSVIPDQIEAGTFMIAAAATKGDVLVTNVIPKHLEPITSKMRKIGVNIEEFDDSVRVWVDGPLVRTNVKTMPHPGFPTDMQPQITTLLTLAEVPASSQRVSGNSGSAMWTNSAAWVQIFPWTARLP